MNTTHVRALRRLLLLAGLVPLGVAGHAHAQIGGTYNLTWNTIDGGGTTFSVGGTYSLGGTVGQHDAGIHAGGHYGLGGGFWAFASIAPTCYPNCDNSTTPPILNVQDFSCFLNAFASGEVYANCDNSTTPPILNVQDFSCFLNAFASGCP